MSLALVLAAMAWLSRLVLKLDAEGKTALQQAAFEENVRLALWRMDSALTGLISLENARPYVSYQSLIRALPESSNPEPAGTLPAEPSMKSLLYFQFEPDGRLLLPEAAKNQSAQLDKLRHTVTKSALLRSIQYTTEILTVQKKAEFETQKSAKGAGPDDKRASLSTSPPQAKETTDSGSSSGSALPLQSRMKQDVQQSMSSNELSIRNSLIYKNIRLNVPPELATKSSQEIQQTESPDIAAVPDAAVRSQRQSQTAWGAGSTPQDTKLELMNPVWLDENLFLVRRISIGDKEYFQGCLLNWPGIREMLLKLVNDLLPQAHLVPLQHSPATGETHLLASIPARLIPGPIPAEARNGWTVLHASLGIAWIAVLLATLAVAAVLRRTMELNQRRGAFVSAVTHELRTPLTTFRMYTEMLDEGMVTDSEKQKKYFGTLHSEAERLNHLVENVLGYAQLENNRGGAERIETVRLAELKERIEPRLADRAAKGGMDLNVEMEDAAGPASVQADLSAVERILFNLVDNAGKYGRDPGNSPAIFSIGLKNNKAVLSVRDHGPGIPPRLQKKLFIPFAKSASDAANSAPGIGLGLSISRRLARQMNGDLILDQTVGDGARFVLTLPLA
ncbi:MAG: HAMP domain-containing histidine kinase [Acidobacteria bacterium]|nr:HAMP domain-containing histidine kinase [Acidobacteriota bacterium]